jgi:two-component system, LytTR family, sensor kinase
MSNSESSLGYFYKKIETFDFDQFYTHKTRLVIHFLMWSSFAFLLMITYQLAYKLTFVESLWMTLRLSSVNMSIFYFFFYIIVPKFNHLNRLKSILLLIFSIFFCGFIWLIMTYFLSKIYHYFGIDISAGELKGVITMSATQNFVEAISFKRLISQAIIIFSNLSPFFFFKILFEIFRVYNKVLKVQKQKVNLEIQNINIEKDFLKSQLNPHFLFNTLNNLYGLTLKKDDSAPEVILQLSEIMSYTLYESNTQKVLLSKELEFIQNYVQLEKMRHSTVKNIHIDIRNNEVLPLRIAPLLLFTFIENAFKYGLQNKSDAFFLLNIVIENNQLMFYLENDFIAKRSPYEKSGIGISNTKKRLQLLYPNQHELEISEIGNRFIVKLNILFN